ncbi:MULTISPECIES: lysozyme inhibitor LprI family protein [unclassified Phaeobacter]|uniref:lysozyme inhibitor LprI family protein n=1 Tax=unclassified Phaeobacter TaxID=2621772 RepID=UPI003A893387
MRRHIVTLALALPLPVLADPAMECSGAVSQVDLRSCLEADENRANMALSQAFDYARNTMAELDDTTGRPAAIPALEAGQASWETFRGDHCAFVGETFAGGSGTGIAVLSCRIGLTRDRVDALMDYAR